MKAKIDRMEQSDFSNWVIVYYKSGFKRYVTINGWGIYRFNKTQADFLLNAFTVKLDGCTYWVDDPEHWVFAQKKIQDLRRENNAKQSIA